MTLFYAVKTNQHEGILEILKNTGAGFATDGKAASGMIEKNVYFITESR